MRMFIYRKGYIALTDFGRDILSNVGRKFSSFPGASLVIATALPASACAFNAIVSDRFSPIVFHDPTIIVDLERTRPPPCYRSVYTAIDSTSYAVRQA